MSDEVHCVNGQRTAALGAIKGDEPSLSTAATASQVNLVLENNTKNGIVLLLGENAILKNIQAHYIHTDRQTFISKRNLSTCWGRLFSLS